MRTNLRMIRELSRGIKSPSLEELWQRDARRRQRFTANLVGWFALKARKLNFSRRNFMWSWIWDSQSFALVAAASVLLLWGFN